MDTHNTIKSIWCTICKWNFPLKNILKDHALKSGNVFSREAARGMPVSVISDPG